MDRAKLLLKTTGKTIAAVAEETGFTEGAYFTQVFKKYVGMTPTQYRDNQKAQT